MDNFKRIPYTEAQMDICKTLQVGNIVFMSGTEALDYSKNATVAGTIEEQVAVIVFKMNDTLVRHGLTLANMVKHTIYLKKGAAEPIRVLELFHSECYKYAPDLRTHPSTGTIVVVEGLVIEEFMLEVDAIAAIPE